MRSPGVASGGATGKVETGSPLGVAEGAPFWPHAESAMAKQTDNSRTSLG
jgi:hypothetical protein